MKKCGEWTQNFSGQEARKAALNNNILDKDVLNQKIPNRDSSMTIAKPRTQGMDLKKSHVPGW